MSEVNKGARKTARVEIMMFLYLRVPTPKFLMDARGIKVMKLCSSSPISAMTTLKTLARVFGYLGNNV